MSLSTVFNENNLFVLNEEFDTKESFLKRVADEAFKLGYVTSSEECLEALLERESQITTGFMDGFAIPHCKCNAVKSPKMLVFETPAIPWDTLDGNPITFSFVLLIPEESATEHLKLLAEISKSLIDVEYRQSLKNGDESQIYNTILKKF